MCFTNCEVTSFQQCLGHLDSQDSDKSGFCNAYNCSLSSEPLLEITKMLQNFQGSIYYLSFDWYAQYSSLCLEKVCQNEGRRNYLLMA